MKLRYIHVQNLPPLEDISIVFQQSSVLAKPLAVHFVAGVNGTGKTSLLQAITETFISLARSRAKLPFPITIAYDLGNSQDRTILLVVPAEKDQNTALIEFVSVLPTDVDWERIARISLEPESVLPYPVAHRYSGGDLPGGGSIEAYLPSALMVYTSGSSASWQGLFSNQVTIRGNADSSTPADEVLERPIGWDAWREFEHLKLQGAEPNRPKQTGSFNSNLNTQSYGVFMSSEQIKLAVCALALYESIRTTKQKLAQEQEQNIEKYPDKAYRHLLEQIEWDYPTALNLTINFQPDRISRAHSVQLYDLLQLANRVRREPEPGTHRLLSFDLQSTTSNTIVYKTPAMGAPNLLIEALYQIFGGEDATPYKVFQTLYEWQQSGLLTDLSFAIKKSNLEDLILYDWLSDGERMFLGRFAIIYLLQEENDAFIILDEPETHFNDVWKRRLMKFVYRSLGERLSEILISTHSSLVLRDVPSSQVILLFKNEKGTTDIVDFRNPTFGADADEIITSVLDPGQNDDSYSDDEITKALERGKPEELKSLLEEVSPGYWRFRIRDVLEKLNAS
jgi:hypothetical protein